MSIPSPPHPHTKSMDIGYFLTSANTTPTFRQYLSAGSPLCLLLTICKTIYFFLKVQIYLEMSFRRKKKWTFSRVFGIPFPSPPHRLALTGFHSVAYTFTRPGQQNTASACNSRSIPSLLYSQPFNCFLGQITYYTTCQKAYYQQQDT